MSSHLVERAGVWHYRRRVPADVVGHVAKKWWKASLKTSNQQEALTKARELAVQHDRLIADVRGRPLKQRLVDLDKLDRSFFERGALSDKHDIVGRSLAQAERMRLKELVETSGERMHRLTAQEREALRKAGGLVKLIDVVIDERALLHDIKGEIEREVHERHLAMKRLILAKLDVDPHFIGSHEDPSDPTIDVAAEQWFKKRRQDIAAVRRHRVALKRFTEVHGVGIRVSQITRKMIEKYLERIEELTDHRLLPTSMRGGMACLEGLRKVSSPTVNRHLISMKAFLGFCLEKGWVQANNATGFRAPKDIRPKASSRRAFHRDELRIIVNRAIEEEGPDGDMAWLTKIGIYSGARLEEIAQLSKKHVLKVDGVWVIRFDDLEDRSLKSDPSVRYWPIHNAILPDLLAWVDGCRGDQLFPTFKKDKDGKYAVKLSNAYGRLMDRADLSDPTIVFHSFRHTLRREMIAARIDPDVRRVILGHAPRDAHESYAGASLQTAADEFNRMQALF